MDPRSRLALGACALAFALAIADVVRAEDPGAAEGATSAPDAAPASPTPTAGSATSAPPPAAGPDAGAPEFTLDELVVRLPRAEAGRDPTASVTVVEADRFEGEAKGVAELVATSPGVAVSDYGGLGQLATVSIRGSTASGVLILLDGLRLDTAFGGGVDLSTIPRHWIERVEVVRGAEGAHYGAGALGGVVNVVTRRGEAGAWSTEATGGSFGTLSASGEGAASGAGWTLFGAGAVDRTEGDFTYSRRTQPSLPGSPYRTFTRENNGSLRGGGLAKLGARLGGARLDALVQLSGGRRELAGWPGYDTPRDWQQDGRALLSARLSAPGPSRGLTLAARLGGRLDLLDTRMAALDGGDPVRQRGGAAGLEVEALLARGPALLRAAAEGEEELLRADGLGGTRDRARLAGTLSADVRLGRLRLAPAVRADRVGPFDGLSAKLGAGWRIAGPLSARASAGRTFRAPSFAELHLQQGAALPNPDLRPERGAGGDAALVVDGARGMASLGAHATLYDDLILYQGTGFGRLKPFNAGKARVAGLEAEVASAPAPRLLGLSLSAAYTLLLTENLRGEEEALGKDLPLRPRHRLYARAGLAPGPAELHLEAHHVGRQWQDARNVIPIRAATLWNAGGSVRLTRAARLRLALEVRNVLDRRTVEDPIGNPLPGRMVMVTVRAGSPHPRETP